MPLDPTVVEAAAVGGATFRPRSNEKTIAIRHILEELLIFDFAVLKLGKKPKNIHGRGSFWSIFLQSYSAVFLTCFPSPLEQEQCLEKVTNYWTWASNLRNLFSTQCPCSQDLGKQVTHTWKGFLTATLDNYSNKLLISD